MSNIKIKRDAEGNYEGGLIPDFWNVAKEDKTFYEKLAFGLKMGVGCGIAKWGFDIGKMKTGFDYPSMRVILSRLRFNLLASTAVVTGYYTMEEIIKSSRGGKDDYWNSIGATTAIGSVIGTIYTPNKIGRVATLFLFSSILFELSGGIGMDPAIRFLPRRVPFGQTDPLKNPLDEE